MKSWGCPWFPFVLELLREAAAKSPCPLTKEGYRGFPMARQHDRRQPAPGRRDGHDHRRGAVRPLARLTAMASITAPLSSRTVAADRSLEAPAPGHRDGAIRSPVSYPTRATERPSSEVWCQRAGLGRVGGECSFLAWGLRHQAPTFWPGACATRLQHAAPFGSWLQGPGVNRQRATAMKPWQTSCAKNEPCNAGTSFRLSHRGSSGDFQAVLMHEPMRYDRLRDCY